MSYLYGLHIPLMTCCTLNEVNWALVWGCLPNQQHFAITGFVHYYITANRSLARKYHCASPCMACRTADFERSYTVKQHPMGCLCPGLCRDASLDGCFILGSSVSNHALNVAAKPAEADRSRGCNCRCKHYAAYMRANFLAEKLCSR